MERASATGPVGLAHTLPSGESGCCAERQKTEKILEQMASGSRPGRVESEDVQRTQKGRGDRRGDRRLECPGRRRLAGFLRTREGGVEPGNPWVPERPVFQGAGMSSCRRSQTSLVIRRVTWFPRQGTGEDTEGLGTPDRSLESGATGGSGS